MLRSFPDSAEYGAGKCNARPYSALHFFVVFIAGYAGLIVIDAASRLLMSLAMPIEFSKKLKSSIGRE